MTRMTLCVLFEASAALSCGIAAKSPRSGCGLHGRRTQRAAKGKKRICYRPERRMDWASTKIEGRKPLVGELLAGHLRSKSIHKGA